MLQAGQEHYHHWTDGEIVGTKATKPYSGRLENKTHLFSSLQVSLLYRTTAIGQRSSYVILKNHDHDTTSHFTITINKPLPQTRGHVIVVAIF